MRKIQDALFAALFIVLIASGCASLKEISDENPVLVYFGFSNAVSQRIKSSGDEQAKASFYMGLVSRLRGIGGAVPYSLLGETIRASIKYDDMHPADKKAVNDLLYISNLYLDKELKKRGFTEIPPDFSVDISAYLDAIEAGARVYLP